MKETRSEYQRRRIKYRNEFMKRRLVFLSKKREEYRDKVMKKKGVHSEESDYPMIELEEIEYFLEYPEGYIPSISVMTLDAFDNALLFPLNYEEANLPPQKITARNDRLLIKHVVADYKLIPITIDLWNKKEDIIRDVRHLLDTLSREARILGIDLGGGKIHWKDLDNYLRVYDLKHEKPKMSWSDIAKEIFPDEVYKNIAPHRTVIFKELAYQSAKDRVRYYWKQANRMIHEGGWRTI